MCNHDRAEVVHRCNERKFDIFSFPPCQNVAASPQAGPGTSGGGTTRSNIFTPDQPHPSTAAIAAVASSGITPAVLSQPPTTGKGNAEEKKRKRLPPWKDAVLVNRLGKVLYVLTFVLFNVIFWIVALQEYLRDAEHYLKDREIA